MSESEGALVLIPNQLGDNPRLMFADHPLLKGVVAGLTGLLSENGQGGRRLLKRLGQRLPIEVMQRGRGRFAGFEILDLIAKGERWGFVCDAGWPAIADPGADLVFAARERNLNVEICAGSSSLMLALALSGLPSQSFLFHGYLPVKRDDVCKKLGDIVCMRSIQAHLCIETPYRNQRLLGILIDQLPSTWWLSACSSLSLQDETVVTRQITTWRKARSFPQLDKRPTVFVISALAKNS